METKSGPQFRDIISARRYVHLFGTGDAHPVDPAGCSKVILSAFMSNPQNPVLEYSAMSFRVALSNHANFDRTLEYVLATGAKSVVTDNTRGGHGVELALELRSRLGIEARPSTPGSVWE